MTNHSFVIFVKLWADVVHHNQFLHVAKEITEVTQIIFTLFLSDLQSWNANFEEKKYY